MGPIATSTVYYDEYRHRQHQPGRLIVFVWSLLATAVLFAYIVFAVILYTEQRSFHRRQQELLQNWEDTATQPGSLSRTRAARERRGRRLERTPLVDHGEVDPHDSDDSTYGGSSTTLFTNSGQVNGYGTTDGHPSIDPAPSYNEHESNNRFEVPGDAIYLPPPYFPISPVQSIHSPNPTCVEHLDHGDDLEVIEEAADATTSIPVGLFSDNDRQDFSGVTADGNDVAGWTAGSDWISNENDGPTAIVTSGPENLEPAGDQLSSSSSSSSSKSTHVLDGHGLVAKFKRGVHWNLSQKGASSAASSSSISSPQINSQPEEAHEGLRKRGGQE